ncbi:MAG TPA: GNAT family N-acetyltransferase [Candidatus Desulfobacillus denitrificans]|nr:GNAT family N-acetyltransferase [Candidatus Desulfobacillus denitrificans]HNT63050.1 GNAT family N-acetyltransferase [Candidatus Desulfobacillus denitrificans]
MIAPCTETDIPAMFAVINDAAHAYRGHVPDDCLHEPYMSESELRGEVVAGVRFFGWFEDGALLGVMGIQDVQDVTLIRHAYVATRARRGGIGGKLLTHLLTLTDRPVLVGTWRAATWAIDFYARHGFRLVDAAEKTALLRKYWTISERQNETSVVLAQDTLPKLKSLER